METLTNYKVGAVVFSDEVSAELHERIINARSLIKDARKELVILKMYCTHKELSEVVQELTINGEQIQGIDTSHTFYEKIRVNRHNCLCCGSSITVDMESNILSVIDWEL